MVFVVKSVAGYCKLIAKMIPLPAVSLTAFTSVANTPQVKFLEDLFKKSGFELRIAGGAVRDLLLGQVPHDVDFATTATPQQMIEIMNPHSDRIRLILTRAGERHGTVTARVDQLCQYEITTLRTDKITDGRHAEVEFIKDWEQDAARRDLTINSMFLDLEGNLYDYFNGMEDLENRTIRFVGNPSERIKEDYLRILRYFRFFARYGKQSHHKETLQCIKDNVDGLSLISGERIWHELKRIFTAKCSDTVIPTMINDVKMGKYFGLMVTEADHVDLSEYSKTHTHLAIGHVSFEPITLFTSLIRNDEELLSVNNRLKLSRAEKDISVFIIENRKLDVIEEKAIKRLLTLESKSEFKNLKRAVLEFLKYSGNVSMLPKLEDWEPPEFPIRGYAVVERVKNRKIIAKVLEQLKEVWIESGFTLSAEQLHIELDSIIKSFNENPQPVKRKSSES